MKLIIGNKKYSSWSLRPWLAMKMMGVAFEEVMSTFDMATTSAHFYDYSPSKKVPVLVHDDLTVWDSLAILEYLAEVFPEKPWWPKNQRTRALARSLANEMHGGFAAVRDECPMNFGRTPGAIELTWRCRWEFERIEAMWADALNASGGPFLFGEFGIADAMYAPVVSRIRTYHIAKGEAMTQYCQTIEGLPDFQNWAVDGQNESWIVKEVEK